MKIIRFIKAIANVIYREYVTLDQNFYWRKKFSNNFTKPGIIYSGVDEFDKVKIGKMTYGSITVLFSGSPNESVEIGAYCSIGGNVKFLPGSEHHTDTVTTYPLRVKKLLENYESISKGNIIVSDDVWISENVTILSGVHIGRGAIIAAGAVVTHSIPAYSIYGGVPAKLIRQRFEDECIEKLNSIDIINLLDLATIHNIDFYYKPLNLKMLKENLSYDK